MAKPATPKTAATPKPKAAAKPRAKPAQKKPAAAKVASASSAPEPKLSATVEVGPEEQRIVAAEPAKNNEPPKLAERLSQGDVWMRGLQMLVLAVLFWASQILLALATVLQFGWLLFAGKRNTDIAHFGENLAQWQAKTARFQTVASDDKPFPWGKLGK